MVEKPVTSVRNYSTPFRRSAIAEPEQRCLVPVTAFSDWRPGQPGRPPLHWFSIPSRPVFAFAGVWRPLGDSAVFAFLTCNPNPLVAPIHPDAMPVILHEEDHDRWLECSYAAAIELAVPYPSQLMAAACPTAASVDIGISVDA